MSCIYRTRSASQTSSSPTASLDQLEYRIEGYSNSKTHQARNIRSQSSKFGSTMGRNISMSRTTRTGGESVRTRLTEENLRLHSSAHIKVCGPYCRYQATEANKSPRPTAPTAWEKSQTGLHTTTSMTTMTDPTMETWTQGDTISL